MDEEILYNREDDGRVFFEKEWVNKSLIFFTQTVELGEGSAYLHTEQHKHRINAYTDVHDLSEIRSYDSSVRASEESSCLRRHGHCDRHYEKLGK
jgi:hypothetical protein